jgi:hypothetical protein
MSAMEIEIGEVQPVTVIGYNEVLVSTLRAFLEIGK